MTNALSVRTWWVCLATVACLFAACTVTTTEEMTGTPVAPETPTAQMEQTIMVENMTPEETMDTAVTLQAEAQVQANTLMLTYQVTNGLDETIYLVNRLFQWTADGLSVDPNLIYASREGETVRLVKACLPVPHDLDVESPLVPYLTAVSPGETFTETVTLPLPLMPHDPYGQLLPGAQVKEYGAVEFVLGWFQEGATAVNQQTQPDGSTLLSAEYGQVKQLQEILTSSLSVQIPSYIQ